MVGLLSMAIVVTSLVIVIEKQGIYERAAPVWMLRMFWLHKTREAAVSYELERRGRRSGAKKMVEFLENSNFFFQIFCRKPHMA
jgi:hypothetical protein